MLSLFQSKTLHKLSYKLTIDSINYFQILYKHIQVTKLNHNKLQHHTKLKKKTSRQV